MGKAIKDKKHNAAVQQVALDAMQVALNASATSQLAMRLTAEALQRSADEETDELLDVLTKVTGGGWARGGAGGRGGRRGGRCELDVLFELILRGVLVTALTVLAPLY